MTFLGAAKGPMTLRTWRTSSFVSEVSSFSSYANSLLQQQWLCNVHLDRKTPTTHGLRVTKAKTVCPVISSAAPITGCILVIELSEVSHYGPAVSATPLCKINADSISAVDKRWPATLITSEYQMRDHSRHQKSASIPSTRPLIQM